MIAPRAKHAIAPILLFLLPLFDYLIAINIIYLAYYFVWPYTNLQARGLGLSMSSIMLIAGIVPFLAFPASPLLGK